MSEITKVVLSDRDMPTHWYNINADLPAAGVEMAPPLHPATMEIVGPDDLAPLFPMALIGQEVSNERWIEIPDEVADIYKLWRPTPLFRARRWEKALDTPARIYYNYEGWSPSGSHKTNTAVAQAYYAKQEGVKRITTETGAGQWGSALSFACQNFGIECMVYMVRISYDQKPYRRVMMQTWGADVVPSPSELTNAGRTILEKSPDSTGSLGIAISEAVEDAIGRDDSKYSLGSVLNFVLMHQTVTGQEAMKQLEIFGEDWPDVVIGCVGGGSNFGGFAFPFLKENITGGKKTRFIAVEPSAAPSLTKGLYAYDYGDTAKMAPIIKMHTLGHDFVPPPIHSGGLRYHGMAAQVSAVAKAGLIEARNLHQLEVFDAAVQFARVEGILPAPEPSHAILAARQEAIACKESGEAKTIVFNLCGHGHFDLAAYDTYLSGNMVDYEYPESEILESLSKLPQVE